MSFSKQIESFNKKALKRYNKVLYMSAFDLFSAIVLATPVDKGTLRNNWYAAIHAPNLTTNDEDSESADVAIGRIKTELAGISKGKNIYFTNNLPYAKRIEFDGYSGKAPEGMVRINTARWSKIVSRNSELVKNEY